MRWCGMAAAALLALPAPGPGGARAEEPPAARGRLRFEPAPWVGKEPYSVRIVSAGDGREVSCVRGGLEEIALPPGSYRVLWRQWEHGMDEADLGLDIAVKAGETAVARIDAGMRLLPAKWVKDPPFYWLLRDPTSGRDVLTVRGTWDPVPAPAGVYTLWYRQWERGSSEVCLARSVTIERGVCRGVDVNTGLAIAPPVAGAEPPRRWVLIAKGTGKEVIAVDGEWGPVPIPPGLYILKVQQAGDGSSSTEVVPDLVIGDGQKVELTLRDGSRRGAR